MNQHLLDNITLSHLYCWLTQSENSLWLDGIISSISCKWRHHRLWRFHILNFLEQDYVFIICFLLSSLLVDLVWSLAWTSGLASKFWSVCALGWDWERNDYIKIQEIQPSYGGFFLAPAESCSLRLQHNATALRAQRWFSRTDERTDGQGV